MYIIGQNYVLKWDSNEDGETFVPDMWDSLQNAS